MAKIIIKPQVESVSEFKGTGEVFRTEIKTCLLCQLCKNDFKKSLMDATAVAPYGREEKYGKILTSMLKA